ncbi:MAG: UDP-2,3-diacylglucosamine diphosphatase [Chitinophagales bacterium]|nr:UDP-2,3-diacylglucosamine diphosphatase [Chitinophagales bacterium]MDW8418262.1 UDP-2,3-diacylglucosamine diphosphatase [Chitinophagales bacterium]
MKQRRKVRVCVISDVHLGFLGCRAKELNRYLESIAPEILIINGDLIDIWQFRKYYFPRSHTRVLQQIFRFVSDGVKVYLLTGNHDELLRRYSGLQLGNLILEDKVVLELDGKKHWFFHGDVFDISVQGSRWIAKLGTTGYEILILLNKFINFFLELFGRPKSSFSQRIKRATKRGVKKLHDYETTAAEIAIENGYDVVANGHSHMPDIREITTDKGKVLYLNSGDWVENLTALEYHEGQWKLIWYKDLHFPYSWLKAEESDLP